jgi:hypothetical protein
MQTQERKIRRKRDGNKEGRGRKILVRKIKID